MNYLPALTPVVKVWDNPLCRPDAELIALYEYQPELGLPMRSLIPREAGRAVLIVNDEPLLQKDWYRLSAPGDVIEWHILSGGKGGSRTILSIIAAIAIAFVLGPAGLGLTGTTLAIATVVANLAAQALINALIPLKTADVTEGQSATSVYNVQLSGNQARLNQPITVIYGRMRHFPDFAAQPYAYYKFNDQFYCALFCIGQGEYAVEALQIDDTPLKNFHGVYYKVLPPGVQPVRVNPAIVTAIEVAGNTLDYERPVGGFAVCKPKSKVYRIEWDLSCEQGLIKYDDDGSLLPFEILYIVEVQDIDDFGTPTGDWRTVTTTVTGSVKAKSRTPQRWTFGVNLASAARVLVRMTRTSVFDESDKISNQLTWTGLRGYLTDEAPLCSTATYLEIVMRANEQLNGLTQKKFNGIFRRKLPVRIGGLGGYWTSPVETRNPFWALADIWRNYVYGDSRIDGEIDIATLQTLADQADLRQDHCDIIFDSRITSKEAARTVAQTGRAFPFQRMGVFTATRDQYQALPAAAYGTRDIVPGSTSIGYALVVPETADCVAYEYFDNRVWDWITIEKNLPGVTTAVRKVTVRVQGVTGEQHATREAAYLAAVNLYRRKYPKWDTELKGLLPAYGSLVIFAPALPNWGKSGDVVVWNKATLVARLSEPPVFVPGKAHFITLEKPNGDLTVAIPVIAGAGFNEVVLSQNPGFGLVTTDSDRERTKYVFGPEGAHRVMVRLMSASSKGRNEQGNPVISMAGVAENNLVHSADNPWLPVGGIVQDPVPTTTVDEASIDDIDSPSTGGAARVTIYDQSFFEYDDGRGGGETYGAIDPVTYGGGATLKFFKNGSMGYATYSNNYYATNLIQTTTGLFPGQWLDRLAEPGYTSLFEIRVSRTYSYYALDGSPLGETLGSPFDVWLNLGAADYAWTFRFNIANSVIYTDTDGYPSYQLPGCLLTTQVRRVNSAHILSTASFFMVANTPLGSTDSAEGDSGD